jgi:hypothetical protein
MTTVADLLISLGWQITSISTILEFGIPVIVTAFLAIEYKIFRDSVESQGGLTPRNYTICLVFTFLSPGSIHFRYSSTRRAVTITSLFLCLLLYQFLVPNSILVLNLIAYLFLLVLRIWALLDMSRIIKSIISVDASSRSLPLYATPHILINFSFIVLTIFMVTGYLRDNNLILTVNNDIFVAFLQVIAILVGFLVVMSFYYIDRFRDQTTRDDSDPGVQGQIRSTNKLLSLTFFLFFIGIIFSIVGILLNSQEIIHSKTDTLLSGLPMLFFFLDSAFVIIGLFIVYSLWSSYRTI